VQTDSTHPDEGLFLKSAPEIARALASKRVSPKGTASGMRMLNFYINRAGKNLTSERQHELERAKDLLSKRIAREKEASATSSNTAKRSGSTATRSTSSSSSSRRSSASHRGARRASGSRSK
jgi:tRNA(adenine34) deaminase